MLSVLNEISFLRDQTPMTVDHKNSNRYRLQALESNGTKTAYCFSTPIYNSKTRKLLDLCFRPEENNARYTGSSADIYISKDIELQNENGSCTIQWDNNPGFISKKEISCSNDKLVPTANGVAVKAYVKGKQKISFVLETDRPFMQIRANNKYFALMQEEFRPFITVSCIGSLDMSGQLIAPAVIGYQKISDQKYLLSVTSQTPFGAYVMFEINLYEPKLFQDTTVETMRPNENNAFGSTAFIGSTQAYGEQWLYTRPDFSKIPEITEQRIYKAVLHLPKHSAGEEKLRAFKTAFRFCSFGSTWNNKADKLENFADSYADAKYQHIDLTELITDSKRRLLTMSDGFILKPLIKSSGFTAVSTGDSYYAPQIFEINFR